MIFFLNVQFWVKTPLHDTQYYESLWQRRHGENFTFDEDDEVISSLLTKNAFDSDFKKRF